MWQANALDESVPSKAFSHMLVSNSSTIQPTLPPHSDVRYHYHQGGSPLNFCAGRSQAEDGGWEGGGGVDSTS